ncbi:MAG: hypothetical protein JST66_08900 [Bacteroidetes bacterium]|nr:hypothetical protein [Bacteroidota bacterium]
MFTPSIESRSTQELLSIAADQEAWQPEARALAEMELDRRGVSRRSVDEAKAVASERYTADLRQRAFNAGESYAAGTMARIFIMAPFLVLMKLISWKFHFSFRLGLTELGAGNFKKKYRQRMTLLVAGTSLWILVLASLSR